MTYDPTDPEQWARRLVSGAQRPPPLPVLATLFANGTDSLAHQLLTCAFGGVLPVRYQQQIPAWAHDEHHVDFAQRLMYGLHMYGGDLTRLTAEGPDYLRDLARANMQPLLYVPISSTYNKPSHAVVLVTRVVRAFLHGMRRVMEGIRPVLCTIPDHNLGLYTTIPALYGSSLLLYLNAAVCEGVFNRGEPSRTMYGGVCMLDEMPHTPTLQVEHMARRLLCFSPDIPNGRQAELEIRLSPPAGTEVRMGETWRATDMKPYNVESCLHKFR